MIKGRALSFKMFFRVAVGRRGSDKLAFGRSQRGTTISDITFCVLVSVVKNIRYEEITRMVTTRKK